MQRRDFLKTGTLAWAGLSLGRRSAAGPSVPVIASTWSFGLRANRTASRTLLEGHSVLDAVQGGVMLIEADPDVTSVGYGGLPNRDGVVELDAAIMNGASLEAGSVAGLRGIKHPVAVARKVMEQTEHVLLVGSGARRFALRQGFKSEKLLTPRARREWKERKAGSRPTDDHDTIGMVALDSSGRMAAACTTSGLAGKLPGRVGDSPLVGHGLYCDDEAGAAVATGVGEEVIKVCGSYQVVEFMRQGLEPAQAVQRVLQRILRRDARNRQRRVGFVALRSDGDLGYGSTIPGFTVAVSRAGQHRLMDAPSMISPAIGFE